MLLMLLLMLVGKIKKIRSSEVVDCADFGMSGSVCDCGV